MMNRERIPNSAKFKPIPVIARIGEPLRRAALATGNRLLATARWRVPWWAAALLIVMVSAPPVVAQLQQSGGSGSSIITWAGGTLGAMANYGTSPGAVLVPGVNAYVTNAPSVKLQDGSGNAITSTTSALDINIKSGSIPSGSNLIGYVAHQNGCGTTVYESGLTYLPNSSTAVTSTATCVSFIILNNTDSSTHTVTVVDQGTGCNSGPCAILSSFIIPINSQLLLPMYGVKMTGGIKWQADATNKVAGDVIGNQ